jgi:hypothetical protein
MPCLWGQHNNSQVFLTVGIIDATAINLTGAGRFGASGPLPNMFQALIDTGAQSTMISTNVVRALNLMPIGKRPIQGVGHNVTYHNEYLFRVAFLFPVPTPGQIGVPSARATAAIYTSKPIHGAELTFTGVGFDVLLGMDIISTGSLKIEGNGTFSFSI